MIVHFRCISSIITAVDEAQVNFAISLLEASSDADSSTVISPFSVAVALAMLYAGSEGRTHDEIRQLLVQSIHVKVFTLERYWEPR